MPSGLDSWVRGLRCRRAVAAIVVAPYRGVSGAVATVVNHIRRRHEDVGVSGLVGRLSYREGRRRDPDDGGGGSVCGFGRTDWGRRWPRSTRMMWLVLRGSAGTIPGWPAAANDHPGGELSR